MRSSYLPTHPSRSLSTSVTFVRLPPLDCWTTQVLISYGSMALKLKSIQAHALLVAWKRCDSYKPSTNPRLRRWRMKTEWWAGGLWDSLTFFFGGVNETQNKFGLCSLTLEGRCWLHRRITFPLRLAWLHQPLVLLLSPLQLLNSSSYRSPLNISHVSLVKAQVQLVVHF